MASNRQGTQKYDLILSSEIENVEKVEELTERVTKKMNFPEDERDSIAIAVTEAVNNAIIHGNKRDPAKKVYLSIHAEGRVFKVSVRDEGPGFNPENLPDPLDPDNLLKESGRGIFILKSLMDEVVFEFAEAGGTIITMVKVKSD